MLFELKQVSKVYESGEVKTTALKEVSLSIDKGELVVILGASGSGKSTLLNVMSGLDTVSSGEILYGDVHLSDYNEKQLTRFRRDNLGFIFQQYNLLPDLTVRENIEIGASIGKHPLPLDEVLSSIGMLELGDKYPSQLSGGQQQRVSIARSIAKNPDVLFCDEPTGALDEETGKQVLSLLQEMNERYETTIVMITHNPSIAELAHLVIKMNSGRIIEVKRNDHIRKASEISWA